MQTERNRSQLVEGNQEDVDLVIATGSELIMIEAKAFGHWDKVPLESKLQRLELLHRVMLRSAQNQIRFRFLLVSPDKPPEFKIAWPTWARKKDEPIPWIQLNVGKRLTVERCDDRHRKSAKGGYWHIIGNGLPRVAEEVEEALECRTPPRDECRG